MSSHGRKSGMQRVGELTRGQRALFKESKDNVQGSSVEGLGQSLGERGISRVA